MLDMRLLKDNPEFVRESCRLKRVTVDVDRAIGLDARRREILLEKETLQNERNCVSKEIAVKKKSGADSSGEQDNMRKAGARIGELESEERGIQDELHRLMLNIPNHPAPDSPVLTDGMVRQALHDA